MKQKYKYSNVLLNSLLDPNGFNLQKLFDKNSPELWIISHDHYKQVFSTETFLKEPEDNDSGKSSKKEYHYSKTQGNENNYYGGRTQKEYQYSNTRGNDGVISKGVKNYKYGNTNENKYNTKEGEDEQQDKKKKPFEYNDILTTEIRKQQQGKIDSTNFDDEFHSIITFMKRHYKMREVGEDCLYSFFNNIQKQIENKTKFPSPYNINCLDDLLNALERKYCLIRNLNYYKSKSLIDRLQFNISSHNTCHFSKIDPNTTKSQSDSKDYNEIMHFPLFHYLTIKFPNEDNKRRRQINEDNGIYNYLPIHCKRYCDKVATEVIKKIKEIVDKCKCEECKRIENYITDHNDKFEKNIKQLYKIACPFAHNEIEIKYHPLNFLTIRCTEPFHISSESSSFFSNEETICPYYHGLDEIRLLFNISEFTEIISLLQKKFPLKSKCYHPLIKTSQCKLLSQSFIKKNLNQHDITKCYDFHNILESRRNRIIRNNKLCENAIDKDHWKEEKDIQCKWKNFCPFFHTRNELLFDKRNYRKLYDCYRSDYCDIGELCPYKHPIDINVEEIYLPEKEKEVIKEKLEDIKKNDNEIQFLKNEYLKDFECIICKRYDITAFYVYDKCGHIICEKCIGNITECPECEDLDNTPILIDLNINA